MLSSFKVFLAALALSSLAATTAAKGHKDSYPPKQDGKGRCDDEDQTILELVLCSSGDPGTYDNNKKDFDILREAVLFAGVANVVGDPNEDGFEEHTLFMPYDLAFFRTAESLGYNGRYDEEKIVRFFAGLGEEVVTNVLLYHFVDDELDFHDLQEAAKDKDEIETLLGQDIMVKKAKRRMGFKRLKLVDFGKQLPVIHNRWRNMETANGLVHVIKKVVIPDLS